MNSLSIFGTSSDAGKSTLAFSIIYLLHHRCVSVASVKVTKTFEDENIDKRPLNKLMKDISEELKLI